MPVTTEELSAGLAGALDSEIVRVLRAPCPYQSSYALEKIDVTLGDGRELRLMFKDLGSEGMAVKPRFVYHPLREIRTYEDVLSGLDSGPPAFFGSVIDERIDRYWLFIENVTGVELYQIGDIGSWQAVGRWLASFHERHAASVASLGKTVPLLFYTEDFCNVWMRRAEQFFENACSQYGNMMDLIRKYEKAVQRIGMLPVTFLHGEFYPSNILLDSTGEMLRVCPVDWEMAGVGPAAIDLAALISGRWSDNERSSIVNAYISCRSNRGQGIDAEQFLSDLDCCRLYVAVQWLGWFGHQAPYEPHRQDWLGEAFRLADKIA